MSLTRTQVRRASEAYALQMNTLDPTIDVTRHSFLDALNQLTYIEGYLATGGEPRLEVLATMNVLLTNSVVVRDLTCATDHPQEAAEFWDRYSDLVEPRTRYYLAQVIAVCCWQHGDLKHAAALTLKLLQVMPEDMPGRALSEQMRDLLALQEPVPSKWVDGTLDERRRRMLPAAYRDLIP